MRKSFENLSGKICLFVCWKIYGQLVEEAQIIVTHKEIILNHSITIC